MIERPCEVELSEEGHNFIYSHVLGAVTLRMKMGGNWNVSSFVFWKLELLL